VIARGRIGTVDLPSFQQEHSAMPRHYDPNQPRVPAGNSDGGQWTDGGHGHGGTLWLARGPLKPSSSALHSTIQGALALFTWLSALNSRNQRAVVAFKAREYPVRNAFLDLEGVRLLNREEVSEICEKLDDVQTATNEAAVDKGPPTAYRTPAEYGTAVHAELASKISALEDANFKAEASYLKSIEEAPDRKGEATYGQKDTIRIDVYENTGTGTVCVYDIKTGRRGLSVPRMLEIAATVHRSYANVHRIIVTEVRPQ